MRTVAIMAALVTAAIIGAVAAIIAMAQSNPYALPPCATEDSTGCYWDSDTMGNGIGNDVVTITE